MKNNHQAVLKEITDELELLMVSGGKGSGDWGTGAQGVWAAGVEGVTGKSCSYPGGFYGPSNPTPTGSGLCTGGRPRTPPFCRTTEGMKTEACYGL